MPKYEFTGEIKTMFGVVMKQIRRLRDGAEKNNIALDV